MTDRYYPKNCVPDYPKDSTYNEACQMETHPRSRNPPGYTGVEYLKRQKFGYANPAPDPTPSAPIDGEDPLVNFGIGEYVTTQSLKSKPLTLEKKPKKADQLEKFQTRPFLGDEMSCPGPVEGEDDFNLTFKCQTSKYLHSKNADATAVVDKAQPYTPAVPGRGTGYNGDAGTLRSGGRLQASTTTADAFPPPANMRQGLECLAYTRALSGQTQK